MNQKAQDLFPTVNPNIGELMKTPVSKADVVKSDILIPEDEVDLLDIKNEKILKKEDEIFMTGKKSAPQKKVEFTETSSDFKEDVKTTPVKKNYPHLEEARKKGHMTRKEKAELRKKQKEEEKLRKAEERKLRREATMERNRQKARERYHREKLKKAESQKKEQQEFHAKIAKDNQPKTQREKQIKQMYNKGHMDFKTFSQYMMKYEQMKDAYHAEKQKRIKATEAKKKKSEPIPIKKEFPDNYPLAHLYSRNRKKNTYII